MNTSRIGLLVTCAISVLTAACGSEAARTPEPAGQTPGGSGGSAATPAPGPAASPGAAASGLFAGVYEVPVAPELTAAATFAVNDFSWTVTNGTARLAYNLPRELVGMTLGVDFTGPFDPASNHASLTGLAGTAECVISATEIVCHEVMSGLKPISADLAVVEKLAGSYAGPAVDRRTVAVGFAGDPIGIARLDLNRPGIVEPTESGK